jgi:hypothetical protein
MNAIKLIPVVLCCLLLGAHFLRSGMLPLVALCLVLPGLLLLRRAWVARLLQAVLVLGALEWGRTLLVLVAQRQDAETPWARLAVILGVVIALNAASALLFCCRSLKDRYRLGSVGPEPCQASQE